MKYERFHYGTWLEVERRAAELGIAFPYEADPSPLFHPVHVHGKRLPNRLVVQPIETCDALANGSPSNLTLRKYDRFAAGSAGILWVEATAAHPDYRSSNGQLYLSAENVPQYARMVERLRRQYEQRFGFAPVLILQVTHSGRYRKLHNHPAPVIAQHNPYLEREPLQNAHVVTDDELRRIEEQFGRAAQLVRQAGFDGMDIKCSHFYLGSELLSAYDRTGPYGGSFENRTRFLMNCMRAAAPATDRNFFLTCRLNAFDGFPYPYGFGVTEGGELTPDYTETCEIVRRLHREFGVDLINITLGNPYFNPYVNRPYDCGPVEPQEHPFAGVARMLESARAVKQANPEVTVLASGLSYMREFSAGMFAAAITRGDFDLAGFGRLALACPDFPQKIAAGTLRRGDCCVTCTNCSNLMRKFRPSGCVVHDREQYSLNDGESVKRICSNSVR